MSKDLRFRFGGAVAIAIGVALGWFAIWKPLQAAHAGVGTVGFYPKLFIRVPVCIVFGLAFLFAGDSFEYRNAEHNQLTPIGWALFTVAAVLAGVGYFWLEGQFAMLGYQSG